MPDTLVGWMAKKRLRDTALGEMTFLYSFFCARLFITAMYLVVRMQR